MNRAYKRIFTAKVASAITTAKSLDAVSHPGLKGELLEIIVGEILRPLLPTDIGIGSGQITTSYSEELSTQQDVILYDRTVLPPVLIDKEKGIFPIESVLYTIEVKTKLTKRELRLAHESALKIKQMEAPIIRSNPGYSPIIHTVFALDNDLSSSNEIVRYKKIYGYNPPIRSICVVGKEYWYEHRGIWKGPKIVEPFQEVLSIISGIMNTYKSISPTRKALLGYYLLEGGRDDSINWHSSRTEPVLVVQCSKCKVEHYINFAHGLDLNPPQGYFIDQPCYCGALIKAQAGEYEIIDGLITLKIPRERP
jgi:hypothetical protein